MEMHQVRYFVAVCDVLNFTRAAERCNVSQPSLTRAVRLLEDELGGPLFNRERNNTHLTELGRIMEGHLREVQAQSQNARARANAFFELKTARLKLGLARGAAYQLVDDSLQRFAKAYPDTEIVLLDDQTPVLTEALLRGDLEIVVVPLRPLDLDELHFYPIVRDHAQVLVRPDHRFAAANAVTLADLAQEALVCYETCPFEEAIERHFQSQGAALRPRITVGRPEWVAQVVRSGLGVGVVGTAAGVPDGLVGRGVMDLATEKEINIATKRGRLYSPPVKAFVDIVLRPKRPQADPGALPAA